MNYWPPKTSFLPTIGPQRVYFYQPLAPKELISTNHWPPKNLFLIHIGPKGYVSIHFSPLNRYCNEALTPPPREMYAHSLYPYGMCPTQWVKNGIKKKVLLFKDDKMQVIWKMSQFFSFQYSINNIFNLKITTNKHHNVEKFRFEN